MRRRAALGLLLSAGACRRSGRRRIGVVPKGRAHLFWQSIHAGAVAAARETGVDILWNGPATETDMTGQIQIVESMINQRLDAICLAPIDRTAMVAVVDRAARQSIPMIIFDSPVDTRNFVSQVATDNYRAGELAAGRMGRILGGKGRVAVVAVQPGAASTMAREQGFEDALKKQFAAIEILDKRYGWADVAKSLAVAENILTAHGSLDGMFASNESSTVGAAQALKARKSAVKLVGFDWSPSLLADLEAGLIDSLVVQDPFGMGYQAVKAAVEKLDGRAPQRIHDMPPRVVTRENLKDPEIHSQLHPDLEKYLQ
ncbi:MAG: substrate-binding domain-containing protein [Acidobacteria bacterium]|nr:substrate-binding domain-containing protein [Acidobacteriota bacterium]